MVAKPASIEHGSKVDMIFLSQVISTIQKTIHALPRVNCVKKYQNIFSVPKNSEVLCKKCDPFANSPTLPGFFCLAIDPNVTFQKGSEKSQDLESILSRVGNESPPLETCCWGEFCHEFDHSPTWKIFKYQDDFFYEPLVGATFLWLRNHPWKIKRVEVLPTCV